MHAGNPKKGLPWATVVGVVADTKLGAPDEPSIEQWYAPMQQPATLYGTEPSKHLGGGGGGYITLRSALPPEQMIHVLRSTVAELDPLLPLQQVQTMDDVISNVEAPRRFNTTLITTFAIGALLLALTGIYAVFAFSVSLRTQEIAIRMALGAQRANITRLVLISGAKITLMGCGLGVFASFGVSHLISSLLFEISATDPLTYAASVLLMLVMALFASALPATRAASMDPLVSLRST
jgi:putative ABC transport system permease protein